MTTREERCSNSITFSGPRRTSTRGRVCSALDRRCSVARRRASGFWNPQQSRRPRRRPYLEIISPDPAQPLEGNRGGQIAALPHPGLITFAVRTTDVAALRVGGRTRRAGREGPVAMTRTRPDGVTLAWSILHLHHPDLGEAIPFAIDWGASPHPSASTPAGCRLKT